MSHVKVILDNVKCKDTEDVFGADEFYLVGSITDGGSVNPILVKPFSIKNGKTKKINTVIFDQDVPSERNLKLAIYAYDQDSSHDWKKYGTYATAISAAVSKGLQAIPNPYTIAAGYILPHIVAGSGVLMSLDKDDRLGKLTMDFPVWGLNKGDHEYTWTIKGGGGWYSSWKYVLRYRVLVS